MNPDSSEEFYNVVCTKLYTHMVYGYNLKSLRKQTGYKKSFILEVFKMEDFHRFINVIIMYHAIYSEKDPSTVKKWLDNLTYVLINKPDYFSDPEDYLRDFYYVDNKWVKKDINGCIVHRLEALEVPEHFNDEWVQILGKRHELMMFEHLT